MALTQLKTGAIADDAVTTDKLANAINTERTANTAKVSTTINNNADNRVITGSGTANTLNGESNVVIDSSGRLLLGTTSDTSTGVGSSKLQISGTGADTAGLNLIRTSNDGGGAYLQFTKNRGGATQSGDNCGTIAWMGHDGTDVDSYLATIKVEAGATATSNTMRGDIVFETADGGSVTSERLRIDSDGTLISSTAINGQSIHQFRNNDTSSGSSAMTQELHFNFARTGTANLNLSAARIIAGKEREWVGAASNQDGYLAFHTCGNETPAERMRIDSSGRVGIGTTNPEYLLNVVKGGADMCRFQQTTNNQSDGYEAILIKHAAATSGQNGIGLRFQNSSGTTVGKIDFGQSSTQYRTSSDYRLKENATAISDGITRLKTLKPYRFNWISEPDQPKVDGFFAHEVTAVPEAISGTKDELDSDNKPVYQGIDQSKLVPLLTAALQEEVAKREALEARVAALEAK